MSVFFVFQGKTYPKELQGSYVWAPKVNVKGYKNIGFTTMTYIKRGDFILHSKQGKIVAISHTVSDCHEGCKPESLLSSQFSTQWNQEGYIVDTNYIEFDIPLALKNYRAWLMHHYAPNSAFTHKGTGKQQYMCNLTNDHAIFLIEQAIKLQKNERVLAYLKNALSDVVGEDEYSLIEKEIINDTLDSNDLERPISRDSEQEEQAIVLLHTNKKIPKRNLQRAIEALQKAQYKCEFDEKDKTFVRKNGKPYTEPHHLIPISKYYDFKNSVDICANIVSLCSHCHNLLHYGCFKDKQIILLKLYNERKNALKAAGINLTLEQLESYYK